MTTQTLPTNFNQDVIPSPAVFSKLCKQRLDTADLGVLNAFATASRALQALPKYRAIHGEGTRKKHCVQCHATFTEDGNSDTACAIPHLFEAEPVGTGGKTRDGLREYGHEAVCCGEATVLGDGMGVFEDLDRLDFCFQGRHVAEPGKGRAKHNNINIFPCRLAKRGKCNRVVVWGDAHEMIFSYEVDEEDEAEDEDEDEDDEE